MVAAETKRNPSEFDAPAPGRASTRKEAARFRYPKAEDSAFIELDHRMSRETLVRLLSQVPGVQSFTDHPKSKYQQGNPGIFLLPLILGGM